MIEEKVTDFVGQHQDLTVFMKLMITDMYLEICRNFNF